MRRTIATALLLTVMSGGVWAQQSAPQGSVQKTDVVKKKKASSKKTVPAVELPAQIRPPLPATLMNSAPVKPSVTMESGLLTIDAPNSTLSDVLNGIHRATSAVIEGAAPTERVAVKLGPGNPEQVIAALLRGTPYDYVILGSLGKQDVVTRVLLTRESLQASANSGSSVSDASRLQETRQQEQPQQQSVEDSPAERMSPDDAAVQSTPDTEPDPGRQQVQPEAQTPTEAQQPPPQQDPSQPKSPEQLYKELQQLDQQKQPR
jgi:hypothetical protein